MGIHLFSFLKVDMGTPPQWILNRDQHIISKIKTENIYSVIRGKGIAGQGRPLTKPHRDRQLVKNGSRSQRFLPSPSDPRKLDLQLVLTIQKQTIVLATDSLGTQQKSKENINVKYMVL